MNKFNLFVGIIASVALILSIVGLKPASVQLGGQTSDDWTVGGNLSVTGTGTVTGASTLTGLVTASDDLEVTGDFALATTTNTFAFVLQTATSSIYSNVAQSTTTLFISSGASGLGGQIILEDADAAGCSLISILNGTVRGSTVTCPSN